MARQCQYGLTRPPTGRDPGPENASPRVRPPDVVGPRTKRSIPGVKATLPKPLGREVMRFRERQEKTAGRRGLLSASPLDTSQSCRHRAGACWPPSLPRPCLSRVGTGQSHAGIKEARDSRNSRAPPLARELPGGLVPPGGAHQGPPVLSPEAHWWGWGAPGGGGEDRSIKCGSGGGLRPTGPVIPSQILRRPPP